VARHDFQTLRLDQVSRDFGTTNALRDVTLTVQRGEFIALLGPSGCGKSTALNCIAGLLRLSGGSIWLDDRRIDMLGPERRGFSMVFQNYALFPHMSARGNIAFGLETQGRRGDELGRRVEAALALVRLSNHGDRLPRQLSGGQQQRVAIARAIAVEPSVVLMDEPLSNLDAKLRLEMRAEMRRIHTALGAATIHVTHDQDEALALADRVVMLSEGRVRQVGTPEDLYARPAGPDVAAFMGYRNLLRCPVEAVEGGLAARIGGAALRGTPQGEVGRQAIAAVRPEDLLASPDGPIAARVESIEYRGRDFQGIARSEDGTELFFSAAARLGTGEAIRLTAPPARVLLFPAE